MNQKPSIEIPAPLVRQKKLAHLLSLMDRCSSPKVFSKRIHRFSSGKIHYELPVYSSSDRRPGAETLKVGVFAGIHGDESGGTYALARFAQLVERNPGFARGYALSLFPVANPSGFEYGISTTRRGKDLNRLFWRGSLEPEIRILEREINDSRFNGLISLHVNRNSHGMFGYASGGTLARNLLKPALEAASQYLPVNGESIIDGLPARNGIVSEIHPGALSAPPQVRPRPFEITIEVPAQAPQYLQENGMITALVVVLTEYRNLISYGANL
jgi:hypothetical protein